MHSNCTSVKLPLLKIKRFLGDFGNFDNVLYKYNQIYDKTSETWKSGTALPFNIGQRGCVAIDQFRALLVGGRIPGSGGGRQAAVHIADYRDSSVDTRNDIDEATQWITCGKKKGAQGSEDIIICAGWFDFRQTKSSNGKS